MNRRVDKVTRDVLRGMEVGDSITFVSPNGYAQDSAKSLTYKMHRLEECRFTCRTDGLSMTITRVL